MEADKAAAYYDELSRKGEGAARFKRGLGFSSSSLAADSRRPPSAAGTSFLSNFVRAASPGKAAEIQRQAQLETIQNKLKKKPPPPPQPQPSPSGSDGDADRRRRRRSRSRSRSGSRERNRERRRSSSRERGRSPRRHHAHGRRSGDDDEERYLSRRRRRSRSRSGSDESERGRRSRHGDKRGDYSSRRGRGSRSPPPSPRSRGADRSRRDLNGVDDKKREKDRNANTDYSQLIEGYSQMTPAERVKAKMKLQLSQTAAKDMAKGVTTGWERFDFNKEAPLDDEEIEVAEDDESLVKDIQQSFRYSAVEAKREEEIKAAHDQAMFGVSAVSPVLAEKEVTEETDEKDVKIHGNKTLISEKALAIQGSWRDRMRKPQHGLGN